MKQKRPGGAGRRTLQILAGVLGGWSNVAFARTSPVLVFPGESDRMMVLIVAGILIGGMALIVNQLRKQAQRRREE
jgi:hypothetical protein